MNADLERELVDMADMVDRTRMAKWGARSLVFAFPVLAPLPRLPRIVHKVHKVHNVHNVHNVHRFAETDGMAREARFTLREICSHNSSDTILSSWHSVCVFSRTMRQMKRMGHEAEDEVTTRDFRAAKTCGLPPGHVFRALRFCSRKATGRLAKKSKKSLFFLIYSLFFCINAL